jgi:hypothetical protein
MTQPQVSAENHRPWNVTLHYKDGSSALLTPGDDITPVPERTTQKYADWRLGQQIAQHQREDPAPIRIVVRVFKEPVEKNDEPTATAQWP